MASRNDTSQPTPNNILSVRKRLDEHEKRCDTMFAELNVKMKALEGRVSRVEGIMHEKFAGLETKLDKSASIQEARIVRSVKSARSQGRLSVWRSGAGWSSGLMPWRKP